MTNQTQTKEETKITINNYHEYKVIEKNLVHVDTGEIITNVDMILSFHEIMTDLHKLDEIKDFYFNNWKDREKFTKVYQITNRNILKNISLQALGILYCLIQFTDKTTNEVIINKKDKNLSHDKLLKYINTTKPSLSRYLKELEKNDLITRTGKRNKRIFVNPYFVFNGKNLIANTKKLFDLLDKN